MEEDWLKFLFKKLTEGKVHRHQPDRPRVIYNNKPMLRAGILVCFVGSEPILCRYKSFFEEILMQKGKLRTIHTF